MGSKILTSVTSAGTGLSLIFVLALTSACESTEFTGSRVINAETPAIVEPEEGGATLPPSTAPTVTGVAPTSGPDIGGTALTVTGTGFTALSEVRFGTSDCGSVSYISSTTLTCVTPARPPGIVDVVVLNPDSQVGRLEDGFAFTLNLFLCYLSICPPSNAKVGINSVHSFSATGGIPPYTYSVISGGGSFSGVDLTAPGAAQTITIQVQDSLSTTATANVQILAAPTFSPTTMNIVEGTTKTFNVNAGVPPFTYSIVTAPSTGCTSILPSAGPTANTYVNVKANTGCNDGDTGTLTVTDSEGNSGNATITFYDKVSAGPDQEITTNVCSSSRSIAPSGGIPTGGNYQIQVTPSCNGCTLNGVIQNSVSAPSATFNTASTTVAQNYTIAVTDGEGNTDSMVMTVNPLPDFDLASGFNAARVYEENWSGAYDKIHVIENSSGNGGNYGLKITGGTLPMGMGYGSTYFYEDGAGPNINDPWLFGSVNGGNGTIAFNTPAYNSGSTDEWIIWQDACGEPARIDFRVYSKATVPSDTIIVEDWWYQASVPAYASAYGTLTCSKVSGPSASVYYNSTDHTCDVYSYSAGTLTIKITDGLGIQDTQVLTVNNPIAITPLYMEAEPGFTNYDFNVVDGTGMAGTTFSIDFGPGGIGEDSGIYTAPIFTPALAQIRLVDSSGTAGSNVAIIRTVTKGAAETNFNDEFGYLQTWVGQIYSSLMSSDPNNRDKIGIPFISAKDTARTAYSMASLAVAKEPAINGTVAFFAGAAGDRRDTNNVHSKIFLNLQDLDWDSGSNTAFIDGSFFQGPQNVNFDWIDIVPNVPGLPNTEEVGIFSATHYGSGTGEKFVVAGYHFNGNDRDMLVIQYNYNFGREWIFTFDMSGTGTHEEAGAVYYDSVNNRLLVAGVEGKSGLTSADGTVILMGLTTSGSLDSTFDDNNNDGRDPITGLPAGLRQAFDIEMDGSTIYVAGTAGDYGFVTKFFDPDLNGGYEQDNTFNCAGGSPTGNSAGFIASGSIETHARTVRLNAAKTKLIVGAYIPTTDDLGAATITKSNGCLDTGFDGDGWAEIATSATNYGGMVVLADDSINMVASNSDTGWTFGGGQPGNNDNDLYVARFSTSGVTSITNLHTDPTPNMNSQLNTGGATPGYDYDSYHAGGVVLIPHTIGTQVIYRLLVPGAVYQDTHNAVDEDRWLLDGKVLQTY